MNSILNNKKFGKVMLIISAIFFLWISIFGLVYHINEMSVGTEKSSCLFSGQTEGCAMNFSEHITIWHGMTTTIPQNIMEIISILIMSLVFVTAFILWQNYFYTLSKRIFSRFKLYIRQHPQINLFNYFKEVFSSGILNTKIYKVATI